MHFGKLASTYLAGSSWLSSPAPKDASESSTNPAVSANEFLWDEVPAYPELVYHDCFGSYKCARLEVPMDWNAPKHADNRTVEIAVIKIPATVPVTDERYGGAVVINPGGPGGSGISQVLKMGKPIQTVLSARSPENTTSSSTTDKHFDIISFDPRGVNNTRPFFACFPDFVQQLTFEIENDASGVFDSSNAAFDVYWARTRAMAEDCSRRAVELGIGEHMATASVARDIVEIFERHGEWREKEARALLGQTVGVIAGGQMVMEDGHDTRVLERVKYRPGEERIQYWGFSYGTILGATLSAMYPSRIHRAILDGVADSFDYMRGGWLTNLQDTDLQLAKFGEYCWLGGAKHCALYHEDGPAAILDTFANITTSLLTNPISVPAANGHAATVATYSDLKALFWSKTYSPLKEFPTIARIMAELATGNGTGLVETKRKKLTSLSSGLSPRCALDGAYTPACFNRTSGGSGDFTIGVGILCSDAEPQTDMSKAEYWAYVQELMAQSRLIGDVWASIRVPCTAWRARPAWRYNGTFEARTAHPILWVGNSVDNVTPVRNAHRMARGFEGSVVLQQDGEGHCSSAGVSFCTARALRAYFQTGVLPEKGTVCAVDRVPFDGFSEEEEPEIPQGEEDEELWRAMVKLSMT